VKEAEFDKFADEYRAIHARNIAIAGEPPEYFSEYKIRDIATEYAARRQKHKISILDLGSGIGASVPYLRKYLPRSAITCLDVSAKSLAIGQSRFGDDARFVHFDGSKLPLPDANIDIAFAACVFHHIPRREHVDLLCELHRVLGQDGMAFVFEHNPWNPLTRRAVDTCPFDENADLISAPAMRTSVLAAGFRRAFIRYRIFFPRFLKPLQHCETWLRWLPLGAQYYILAMK
jgi:SAM-dependent methyltransferase